MGEDAAVTTPITSSTCESWPEARSVCVEDGGNVLTVNVLAALRLTAVMVCPLAVSEVPRLAFRAIPICCLAANERFVETITESADPLTEFSVVSAQPG